MTVITATAAPVDQAASAREGRRRSHSGNSQLRAGWFTYLILAVVAVLSLFPLYYTLVMATRTNSEINQVPPPFIPGARLIHNIREAYSLIDLTKAMFNSVIVSGTIAVGTVLFCTMAGFAFAKLRFRFSSVLFGITIGTMLIPPSLGVIPLYQIMVKLGWTGQLKAVILPTLVTAFGVFFMRQFLIQSMPTELLEAGWIDGASTFRIFLSIVLPIARPAMAVLGMLTFLQAWNDFFWPILVLDSSNPTVQVALQQLGVGYVPDRAVILAGTFLTTIPVILIFALLGRQIVGGIMHGALKG
ncbi:MAG: cellobiose transport system permease protein [Mycobacteriales bacterium]|jgi:cellobiose transport system permease protein